MNNHFIKWIKSISIIKSPANTSTGQYLNQVLLKSSICTSTRYNVLSIRINKIKAIIMDWYIHDHNYWMMIRVIWNAVHYRYFISWNKRFPIFWNTLNIYCTIRIWLCVRECVLSIYLCLLRQHHSCLLIFQIQFYKSEENHSRPSNVGF